MEKVDLLVDTKKKAWAKWINRSSSLSSKSRNEYFIRGGVHQQI
jgi:hypothetical protein